MTTSHRGHESAVSEDVRERIVGTLMYHDRMRRVAAESAADRILDLLRTPSGEGEASDEIDPTGYGQDQGPSPLVKGGRLVQMGGRPGQLDAHVRPGMLILRCEAGAGDGNLSPFEMRFNDEDAAILVRVARLAARRSEGGAA